MRVLLVGGGGREYAIAKAVSRSAKNPELYAAMNRRNPGIARLCKDFLLVKETEPEIVDYAVKNRIELAIIGPEAPLAVGIPDLLWDAGTPVVGPRRLAAQIEFDKAWTRNFMEKYGIAGCPDYRIFRQGQDNIYDVGMYIDELYDSGKDAVIKPAGLTGGKGVKLTGEHFDFDGAKNYSMEVLQNDDLVIEEKLIGEEFTVQAFVDGTHLAFAPAVQDHKRAYDGDVKKNPNTGGMGSYNDAKDILPFMKGSDYTGAKKIMTDAVRSVRKETGIPYQGILYGQFMAAAKGISVIEFNARFGDPEAMNVLPLLENDFLDVCMDIVQGTLKPESITFAKKATVCKYVVPDGYPGNGKEGIPIKVGNTGDARIYYAGVYEENGELRTTGSRAIASLGIADTLEEAERISEQGILRLRGNIFSRHKIGTQELIEKKIQHMNDLRAN